MVGTMLRYLTAGESHGRAMVALVDGLPAGLAVEPSWINADLVLRQGGYGRGGRQQIETDHVEFLAGFWRGVTTGAPVAMLIPNRDHRIDSLDDLESPRPGHGDLVGALKYGSIRSVLERASARETATRVAAGSLARQLLAECGIDVLGGVVAIGGVTAPDAPVMPVVRDPFADCSGNINRGEKEICGSKCKNNHIGSFGNASKISEAASLARLRQTRNRSELYTLNPAADAAMKAAIDAAREMGDTLGGVLEIRVTGLPFGLGTHTQWDRRLDGRIAAAVMAVQAIKGVEFGLGFESARRPGSQVHDAILHDPTLVDGRHRGYWRPTNHAGGLEAGMTNSEPLVVRAAMKPIPTLRCGLPSVSMATGESVCAAYERSDVCAVPAAAIVLEAVVAFTVAEALCEFTGGDTIEEMKKRIR